MGGSDRNQTWSVRFIDEGMWEYEKNLFQQEYLMEEIVSWETNRKGRNQKTKYTDLTK